MGDVLLLRALAAASLVVVWAVFVCGQIRRVTHVWRGGNLAFLPLMAPGPEVNRRNYPTFVAGGCMMTGGGVLLLMARLVIGRNELSSWPLFGRIVAYLGLALGLIGSLLLPLLYVITAFNRPRSIVPPPLRGDVGSWARFRARRSSRRAGLPETDHLVEILDVRPAPDDTKQYAPYLVAVCAFKECHWMSDVVESVGKPDAEGVVRQMAASHSSNVVVFRHPVG